jgi:hypothetical protein
MVTLVIVDFGSLLMILLFWFISLCFLLFKPAVRPNLHPPIRGWILLGDLVLLTEIGFEE